MRKHKVAWGPKQTSWIKKHVCATSGLQSYGRFCTNIVGDDFLLLPTWGIFTLR
jgi:hypothetical protein